VVFPSQVRQFSDAARGRCTQHMLQGATHHMQGQPQLIERLADLLVDWGTGLRR
jgi:hypothetical protein